MACAAVPNNWREPPLGTQRQILRICKLAVTSIWRSERIISFMHGLAWLCSILLIHPLLQWEQTSFSRTRPASPKAVRVLSFRVVRLAASAYIPWLSLWTTLQTTCCRPYWTGCPGPPIIRRVLPRIQPINPSRIQVPFDNDNFAFELKHDGFRAVAYIEDGSCRLVSRKHIVYKSFTRLASIMAKLPVKNAILDGELVCLNDDGRSVFVDLMRRKRLDACFYAFDLLWLDGKDLRGLTFLERKKHMTNRHCLPRETGRSTLYAEASRISCRILVSQFHA